MGVQWTTPTTALVIPTPIYRPGKIRREIRIIEKMIKVSISHSVYDMIIKQLLMGNCMGTLMKDRYISHDNSQA